MAKEKRYIFDDGERGNIFSICMERWCFGVCMMDGILAMWSLVDEIHIDLRVVFERVENLEHRRAARSMELG